MLFSVIIPVYNCIAFLGDTVAGIRASGLWDYEILLIDDGSADGSGQLCDLLAREYGEVRCIHQENAGVSAARNRGIQEASGEYILFFDADDSVDAGALETAARQVLKEKPDMLIFGMSFDYYFRGRCYRREALVYPDAGIYSNRQCMEAFGGLYCSNALSPVWNKLICREFLNRHNIRFSGRLIEMEDFVFSVDCLKHSGRVVLLPEAIYRYRQAESERNTCNRLRRVGSLTAYMQPFGRCVEDAVLKMQAPEPQAREMRKVADAIWMNFFRERIRYASPEEIGEVARDALASAYGAVLEREDPSLYEKLRKRQYCRVWMCNGRSRLRHWIAVRVKYLRSLGGR